MASQGGCRVLFSVLLAVLIAYPSWAADRIAGPTEAPFSDSQQATGTLLRSGNEAVSGWEAHERKRRRNTLIRGVAGTALLFGAAALQSTAAGGNIAQLTGTASSLTAEANMLLALGTLNAVGLVITAEGEASRAALENSCGYRGSYLSPAMRVAPQEVLEFASGFPDAPERTRLLAAVLASAAMYAPDMAETTAEELVQAAAASKDDDEDLRAVSLAAAAACSTLGPDHPAVTKCLDCLASALPVSAGKRPSSEKRQAAEIYACLRPHEAERLASTFTDPNDRASILLAAGEGANRWGSRADAGSLLDQAITAANAIKEMPSRAEVLAAIAVSDAAGDRREALISQAVSATRDQRKGRPDTDSVRKVAVQLARRDPARALSILTKDDQPVLGFDFAQSIAPILLAHPAGRVHADLVKRLPRRKEMAPFFHQLAIILSTSADLSLAAPAQEAAQYEVEIAFSLKDRPWRRPYILSALSSLASMKPDLSMEALPRVGKDAEARAGAHFRVMGGFAARAGRDPQTAAGRKDTATALGLLRVGLDEIPSADRMKWYHDLMPEIGAAFVAAYRLSPSDAISLAKNAPAGPVRAEALLQCGIQEALTGSPQAHSLLTDALDAAETGRDRETVDVMVSRASVGLGLVAPDEAEHQLGKLETHWARAGALAQTAQLRDETGSSAWLTTLSEAHAAATEETYAAERAQGVYWIMDAAAAPSGSLRTAVQQTGLPWLVPISTSP